MLTKEIVFPDPASRLQKTELLPGVFPSAVGRNPTVCETPLHVTVPHRWLVSPFRCFTLTVVRPEAWTLTFENCALPPADPPMYPAAADPLQPVHDITLAPPESAAASPS